MLVAGRRGSRELTEAQEPRRKARRGRMHRPRRGPPPRAARVYPGPLGRAHGAHGAGRDGDSGRPALDAFEREQCGAWRRALEPLWAGFPRWSEYYDTRLRALRDRASPSQASLGAHCGAELCGESGGAREGGEVDVLLGCRFSDLMSQDRSAHRATNADCGARRARPGRRCAEPEAGAARRALLRCGSFVFLDFRLFIAFETKRKRPGQWQKPDRPSSGEDSHSYASRGRPPDASLFRGPRLPQAIQRSICIYA